MVFGWALSPKRVAPVRGSVALVPAADSGMTLASVAPDRPESGAERGRATPSASGSVSVWGDGWITAPRGPVSPRSTSADAPRRNRRRILSARERTTPAGGSGGRAPSHLNCADAGWESSPPNRPSLAGAPVATSETSPTSCGSVRREIRPAPGALSRSRSAP